MVGTIKLFVGQSSITSSNASPMAVFRGYSRSNRHTSVLTSIAALHERHVTAGTPIGCESASTTRVYHVCRCHPACNDWRYAPTTDTLAKRVYAITSWKNLDGNHERQVSVLSLFTHDNQLRLTPTKDY